MIVKRKEENMDNTRNITCPSFNDRYPLGYRDKEYVRIRKLENDNHWNNKCVGEKWLYYKQEHQNAILPVAVGNFLMFFGAHPAVSITMIILFDLFIMYACHRDNKTLDYDPYVQWSRKRRRENWEERKRKENLN